MAEKGWTAQVAAAAGVAAGTGAAQLGLGYGLGVVEWPAVPAADNVWLGSLGWATWIAASSTVFGAVLASRFGRPGQALGGPWRFALAASAAVGALLTVALIALPARAAVRTDTFTPQTVAGGYAVIGVLLGLVIAYWAVVSRPVAANLMATSAWLWSLAVAAVLTTILWRPSATYLSSWQFLSPDTAEGRYGIISWPSAALTLLAAFAVGVIAVLPSVRRGDLGVGAAASGAVGPLLVAAAFLVLAPQLTGTPGPLQSAYLIAPYAVLAGLAGSAVAVAPGQRRAARRTGQSPALTADRPTEQAPILDPEDRGSSGSKLSRGADPELAAAAVVVPSPRTAPGRSRSEPPVAPVSSGLSSSSAAPESVQPADAGRPRRSFLDRLRRKNAGAADGDQTATEVASGISDRAESPSSPAESARPALGRAAARPDAADARPPAPGPVGSGVTGPVESGAARSRGSGSSGSTSGGSGAAAAGAAGSGAGRPEAGRSGGVRGGSARSGAASVDGGARPAVSSAPGRSDSRSTVAAPPASPPIAKINESRTGEKSAPARQPAAPPSPRTAPGPTDAVSSDKTPPARKTPAKSTKSTPPAATRAGSPPATGSASPRATTPKQPAAPRAAPAKAARPATPKTESVWSDDADTAELPIQDPKRRPARRPAGEEPT